MTTEKPDNTPDQDEVQHSYEDVKTDVRMADPLDLVSKGGFQGDPREIVENPAVAPEMIDSMPDQSDQFRRDSEDSQ